MKTFKELKHILCCHAAAMFMLSALAVVGCATATAAVRVANPILPGFHPDPSICRVGNDFYLCTSSFTWYPGLPIMHSTDLVHWELVGHAIDRPGMVTLDGVHDKDGIWAPTIRYHDGWFYIFCNVSNGGNFFIKAKDAHGPWSNPVFIRDMPGIDPSVFWDDDGKSYVVGNHGKFPERKYASSTAIWIQEIDLSSGMLVGDRHYISTGHAFNAKFAEGPHLYKMDGQYVLVVAEGGTDIYHASTVMTSKSIFGPYLAQTINPVLSNRQMGSGAKIQSVGHADIVDTPDGSLYAVTLGKRLVDGKYFFTRETFLCPVERQNGELVFNPGFGCMTDSVAVSLQLSEPGKPATQWYYERIPRQQFDVWEDGKLTLALMPETLDSLRSPAMVMRKVSPMGFSASVKLQFKTKKPNEQAGLVVYRNNMAYAALLKSAAGLEVVVSDHGKRSVLASMPFASEDVTLKVLVRGVTAKFSIVFMDGHDEPMATVSLIPLTEDNKMNRFNGTGIAMYGSSNGIHTAAKAVFSNFVYKE
jgi:alpha-N-arabinofuranosidase